MAIMAGCDGQVKVDSMIITYIDNFSLTVNGGTSEASSLGKKYKEFIGTVSDWSGSFSGTFDYADLEQKALVDALVSATPDLGAVTAAFKIGATAEASGEIIITSAAISAAHGDKVTLSCNFQGTGALTIAAPAA